jgi:hypothetical protein
VPYTADQPTWKLRTPSNPEAHELPQVFPAIIAMQLLSEKT